MELGVTGLDFPPFKEFVNFPLEISQKDKEKDEKKKKIDTKVGISHRSGTCQT